MKYKQLREKTIFKWILPFTAILFLIVGAQAVFAGEAINFEQDEYTVELGDYQYISLSSGEADESAWSSSDESVIVISDAYSYGAYIEAVGAGNSTISVSDTEGNTASCTVTVTLPE